MKFGLVHLIIGVLVFALLSYGALSQDSSEAGQDLGQSPTDVNDVTVPVIVQNYAASGGNDAIANEEILDDKYIMSNEESDIQETIVSGNNSEEAANNYVEDDDDQRLTPINNDTLSLMPVYEEGGLLDNISDAGNNQNNSFIYVDIKLLENDTEKVIDNVGLENTSDFEEQTALPNSVPIPDADMDVVILFDDSGAGKKVIETRVPRGADIASLEINIEEEEYNSQSAWKKEVRVSSKEHFNHSLTVYSDIAGGKNVRIYWVSEGNREITDDAEFGVRFYDNDGDGLDEKVSWKIPHLSLQIFDIVSDEDINASDVNFSSEIEVCNLSLSNGFSRLINRSEANNITISLINGNYLWYLNCSDTMDSGSFDVDFNSAILSLDVYINGENISVPVHGGRGSILSFVWPDGRTYNHSIDAENGNAIIPSTEVNGDSVYGLQLLDSRKVNVQISQGNLSLVVNPAAVFRNFSVVSMRIDSASTVNISGAVNMNFSIFSPMPIFECKINFGNGQQTCGGNPYAIFTNVNWSYQNIGTYVLNFSASIMLGIGKFFPVSITKGITVTNFTNNSSKPSVILSSPTEGEVINSSEVIFNFSARNSQHCSFDLYNKSGGNFGVLVYSENKTFQEDANVSIKLIKFDEGSYYWEVNCRNNASTDYSGRNFVIRFDKVNLSSSLPTNISEDFSTEREVVRQTISKINDFLTAIEGYNDEQRAVLDDLGIMGMVDTSKKRLLQIDTDLGNNLRLLAQDVRDKRIIELMDEVAKINNETPVSISVIASDEYIKYSMTNNFEKMLNDYLAAENINTKNNKAFVDYNRRLQSNTTISTIARQIEITYPALKKQLTLVSREINTSAPKILEIIPKELADSAREDIVFINQNKIVIDDPMISIANSDLKGGKIIYTINGLIDLKKTRDIDTISVFEEGTGEELITGYSVFPGFPSGSLWAVLTVAFIILIFIGGRVFSRRISMDETTRHALSLIRQIKKKLASKDLEEATSIYRELHLLYPQLGNKKRGFVIKRAGYVFEEIVFLRAKILAKDTITLVKSGKRREALYSYSLLQQVYRKLPKRHKREVYRKLSLLYNALHRKKK